MKQCLKYEKNQYKIRVKITKAEFINSTIPIFSSSTDRKIFYESKSFISIDNYIRILGFLETAKIQLI